MTRSTSRKIARGPAAPRALSFEQALDTVWAPAMRDFDATAWRPFLRSLDGNAPRDDKEMPGGMSTFEQCTGRTTTFNVPPRVAQACCGRRSGKTRIAALIAATAAAFWRHDYLARGERGRVLLLSATRDQAQVAKNYIVALLESDKVTKAMIEGQSADVIQLTNRIDITITAASFRSVRGFTCPLIIADEVAFWRDTETSTNPAREIMRALAPGQSRHWSTPFSYRVLPSSVTKTSPRRQLITRIITRT
jgi:hypothetical protein